MYLQRIREKCNECQIEKVIGIIFLAGLFLRIIVPNLKLLHHDEAIHAWFSYELLTKGTYQYDPMYHGPLLYYLTALFFRIFGDSDLVARLLPAVFGSAIILLVYGIYKTGWLSRNQTIWTALFFALSPDMVYFSRFLRHDIFQLFFTVLLLLAVLAYLESKKGYWACIAGFAAAAGLCLKEDMPVCILVFGIFFLYLLISRRIRLPGTWLRDLLGAVLVAGITGLLLYTSFFSHPEMFFQAPFKAIEHWTSMSDECRLCGPPYWYILMFLLYELPLLVLAIYNICQWGWKDRGFSGFFSKIPGTSPEKPELPVCKNNYLMVLALIWTVVTLVFYGYVGEKVPWLLIHQLFPVIFLASYRIEGRKILFGIIAAILLMAMTIHVCYTPSDINEPIVQVQNSEGMREVMQIIDQADRVVVASDSYWPLPWYYRGERWDKIRFYGKRVDPTIWSQEKPDVVITHDTDSYSSLPGYAKKTYNLSYWFSWYDNRDRVLPWYFLRDGKRGTVNLDVFVKDGDSTDISPGMYADTRRYA